VLWDSEVAAAVARVASETGVALEPALVQAVIQAETGHKGSGVATNSQGTFYGPMNVAAATARSLGFSDPSALADPATGIYAGATVLANMANDFPGDWGATISAFEGGPGNANRNSAGKFPNQPYVDLVNRLWSQYRLLSPATVAAGGAAAAVLAAVLFVYLSVRRRVRRA
jgi:hypothetical protein